MSDYLFDSIPPIKQKIEESGNIALFLDYDGTLVGFKPHPKDAVPSRQAVSLINSLLNNRKISLFIITGRNEESIRGLLPMGGLKVASMHGFVMSFAGFALKANERDSKTIHMVYDRMRETFTGPDFDVQEKDSIGIGFNYRRYEGAEDWIKENVKKIVEDVDTDKKFRIMHLSKCINIIPKTWNKGKAVNYILESHSPKNSLPVYFGDDTTDEDAFKALKNRGITVYVRNDDARRTVADFYVNDHEEVLRALGELFG